MKNIFDAIPDDLNAEVLEILAKNERTKIERNISKGHTSPDSGWFDPEQNEWVLVLQGRAVLAFSDRPSITLQEGDYINIRSHQKHRVTWTDPIVETIWLAVHY